MMRRLLPLLLLAAAPPDAFTRVIEALSAADTSAGREAAARVLRDASARPLEQTDDLAVRWQAPGAAPAPAWRDRALGPGYRVVAIRPGGKVSFEQLFLAGQRARVAVLARPRGAFALSVTDDDGTQQCGGAPNCDWVPVWTTRYRIVLDNRGPTEVSYTIVMQ